MSSPADSSEELSAAERRLLEHLEIVKDSPPQGDRLLVRRVVRTARWQRALREPLELIGTIATTIVDGIAGLLGVRGGHRR